MAKSVNLTIDKWLGLASDDAGDTNLKVGECSVCTNYKIIEGYNARSREGYQSLLTSFSATNIIINGNFTDGSAWSPTNGTESVASNTYTLTGNGGGDSPTVSEDTGVVATATHQIYVKAKVKVTNAVCENIKLSIDGSTGGTLVVSDTQLIPVNGTTYTLSGIVTLTDQTGNVYVSISNKYADAATANAKVLEVKEVIAVDLTAAFGAGFEESLTNADVTFATWFNGTSTVNANQISTYTGHAIKGQWNGEINNTLFHIFASDGHIYKNNGDGTITDLGTLTDANTYFFYFGDCVYIMNGTEYKKWTGSGVISDVSGYIPKVMTARNIGSTVTGTADEGLNNLTSKRRMTFNGTAGQTVAYLTETNITSVDSVLVNGALQTVTTHYTVDLILGKVTFGTEPSVGLDNVEIAWTNLSKTQYFSGTGSQSTFQLDETNITSIDEIFVNNVSNKTTFVGNVNDYLTTAVPHNYYKGMPVTVVGADLPEPLVSGTTYYVSDISGTSSFQVATSYANAIADTQINITDTGSGTRTIFPTVQAALPVAVNFTGSSATDLITIANHGYGVGQEIIFTGADLPSPLVSGTVYYVSTIAGVNTFNISASYAGAIQGGLSIIDILDNGSGTMTAIAYFKAACVLATGELSIGNPRPPSGTSNIMVRYISNSTNAEDITRQTHARIYGGKNDNRVFLYGYDNNIYYSGLADGVPSAEYFPVLNFIEVGNNNTKVTDLSKQYDRLIIFKEGSTGWTNYEYDSSLGVQFPIYPLNDSIGCTVKGTTQVIKNNPFTIHNNKVWELVASNVRDERNMVHISEKIQNLLDEETMTSAITFDNQADNEYWIVTGSGNTVYVYNYSLNAWYYYVFADVITSIDYTTGICLGTDSGQLMLIGNYMTDNGVAISGTLTTGGLHYGAMNIKKFVNFMWLSMYDNGDRTCDVYVQTDDDAERFVKTVDETMDSTKRIKPKIKKANIIKYTFKHNAEDTLTILSLNAPAEIGGYSK